MADQPKGDWVGLKVLMDMLGTDASGVRKLAREVKADRVKMGNFEVYDRNQIFSALDKSKGKIKKREITPEHLQKMLDGKKKKTKVKKK